MNVQSIALVIILGTLCLPGCRSIMGSRDGMTPFLCAARAGDMEEVERLLAKGADVNQGSAFDWTALMFASWKGHEAVVVRLLDAGADPNRMSRRIARNTQGPIAKTTALAQATKNKHLSIAKTLMDRGAEIDPISVALAAGLEDLSLLKEMVAQGADVNRPAKVVFVSTPLVTACRSGRLENVQWLIAHGAEVSRGALSTAAVHLHFEIAEFLLREDTKHNYFTEEDKSFVLFWVAVKEARAHEFNRQLRVLTLLLEHGARPDFRAENYYPGTLTAAEHLRQKRKRSSGRRYDGPGPFPPQQADSRDGRRTEIIELLEKAEAATRASRGKKD